METHHVNVRRLPLPDVYSSLDRLIQLVELCDVEASLTGVPDVYAARLYRAFDGFVHVFDEVVRTMPQGEADALGAHVRARFLPLLQRSSNGHRWYSKPRGYAGDYLTIARMYDDIAEGSDLVGTLLDRCFLAVPAVRAVQNRRSLLADEIRADSMRLGGPLRVTSLACGPARELLDLTGALAHPLHATLVDMDADALAYCAAHRGRIEVAFAQANLVHVALGRSELALAAQDLVYSVGLIDYLGDAIVVKLLDFIHGTLRPGGRVILGNFHTRNATKAFMDHVLDWKLIHRTESDMRRLFGASRFGTCNRISYEPLRINMFCEGTRA